ncbi:MAG: phosphotransferase [Actinomycetota bacterium]
MTAPAPSSWGIRAETWSSTGIAVFAVGPEGGPPAAMVKIPSSGDGRASQRREGEIVASLRADGRLGDWEALVPVRLAEGTTEGQSWLVESAAPGVPAGRLLAGGAGREALAAAAGAAAALHDRTGRETISGPAELERWVTEPLALARTLGGSPAWERIAAECRSALEGRPVRSSWVHGNYTPSNVLLDPETTSVTGVIDWDWAAPGDLGVLDAVHLVVSAIGDTSARELGDVVVPGLRGQDWAGEFHDLVTASVATTLPGAEVPDRVLLLLFWLRHVASNLTQQPRYYRRNLLWRRRNVDAVLQAV